MATAYTQPLSLRRRLALYSSLLGLVISLFLMLAFYWAEQDVSGRLIDETLTAEMDDYLARHERNPKSLPPTTNTLHGYVAVPATVPDLPVYLQTLQPGRYHLSVGQAVYRVAVADRQGTRYFILYDTSLQQRREQRFLVLLAIGAFIALLLSWFIGMRLTHWVILPLRTLVRQTHERHHNPGLNPSSIGSTPALYAADDELGELARILEQTTGQIHALVQRERQFSADLSHELRTALAVILSATEILLEDTQLNQRQHQRIARIDRTAKEIAEMGIALLLMAREENWPQNNEPCAVAPLINEIVDKHRPLLGQKPVQLETTLDQDFYVIADRSLLYIAISNLIRNAIAYTEQGHIQIKLEAGILLITDTGRGFAVEQAENLFLRYFKGASSAGSGIGLALVKRIIEIYGWQIRLFPNPAGGTLVEINFIARQ